MLNKYFLKKLLLLKWYYFLIPLLLFTTNELVYLFEGIILYVFASFYFLYQISLIFNFYQKLFYLKYIYKIILFLNIFFYLIYSLGVLNRFYNYELFQFGRNLDLGNLELYFAILLFILIIFLNPILSSLNFVKYNMKTTNLLNIIKYYFIFLFFLFTCWSIVPKINKIFKE